MGVGMGVMGVVSGVGTGADTGIGIGIGTNPGAGTALSSDVRTSSGVPAGSPGVETGQEALPLPVFSWGRYLSAGPAEKPGVANVPVNADQEEDDDSAKELFGFSGFASAVEDGRGFVFSSLSGGEISTMISPRDFSPLLLPEGSDLGGVSEGIEKSLSSLSSLSKEEGGRAPDAMLIFSLGAHLPSGRNVQKEKSKVIRAKPEKPALAGLMEGRIKDPGVSFKTWLTPREAAGLQQEVDMANFGRSAKQSRVNPISRSPHNLEDLIQGFQETNLGSSDSDSRVSEDDETGMGLVL
jgi:hypothetical protein